MILQKLNEQQLQAVTCPLAPTLVLAGAGSGKTRVLTNRILYLVNHYGVNPSEILAITFTNKAAKEMKNRLFQFDCHAERMHVSTIHSFCATVLRNEAQSLNRNSNFTIYDESEKKSVIRKIVKEYFDDGDAKMVEGFCDSISEIKNNSPQVLQGDLKVALQTDKSFSDQIDKLEELTQCSHQQQLLQILQQYSAKMEQSNAMDFDDLLFFVHKLFSQVPEVLEKYREQYKYILIDEFQDTNKVQYQIFKMLGDKYRNIFVVGDDDQSIYSWRGADAYNLQKFSKDYENCNVFKLEQNYRSTKRILDVANHLIEVNPNRFEKVLRTENVDGVKVQLYDAYNEQDEAYFVCEQIANLLAINGNLKLSDFAILMRVNALSRTFEQQFRARKMPYKIFGGFKFYERAEIKDVLSYLKLIFNPSDSEAFCRAINAPTRRGIGDTTLQKLRDISADYGISLLDVISDERNLMDIARGTRAKLLDFYKLIDQLTLLSRTCNVSYFINQALDILQFRQTYMQNDEEERALNIDEFEESVNEFQSYQPDADLGDFLQSVSLASDLDENVNGDCVSIATIHAVKGLEFKVVFVVGLEEGIFPASRSTYDSERLHEERRLMYVAVTRAQQRLFLTRCKSRFLWGKRQNAMASKYFCEVQRFLAPVRQPATERQLANDAFLDRLSQKEPSGTAPNPGKTSTQIKQYHVGQIVEHKSFGKGIILRIDGNVADIVFDGVGKKCLDLKFAPLTIC